MSKANFSSVCLPPTTTEENHNGNKEEITILNQLRPVIRKFVTAVKDYSKFVDLSHTYAGKLDPNFVTGMSKVLNGIQSNIRLLVGNRWPKAVEFLDQKFHQSMVELDEKAKAAVKGQFHKEFSILFKKMLEQCYMFIKLIRMHFTQVPVQIKMEPTLASPVVSTTSTGSISPVVSPRNAVSSPLIRNSTVTSPKNNEDSTKRRKSTISLKRTRTTTARALPKPQESSVSIQNVPQTPLTKWRCFKCTVINTKGEKCNMCGESKPLMFEMVSSPTSQSHIDELRVNTKWICTCCKFINAATSPECEMCSQSQTASISSILETGWTCNSCTILNSGISSKCSSCGLHRNHRGRSASSPQLESKSVISSINSQQQIQKDPSKRKITPLSQANLNIKNN